MSLEKNCQKISGKEKTKKQKKNAERFRNFFSQMLNVLEECFVFFGENKGMLDPIINFFDFVGYVFRPALACCL